MLFYHKLFFFKVTVNLIWNKIIFLRLKLGLKPLLKKTWDFWSGKRRSKRETLRVVEYFRFLRGGSKSSLRSASSLRESELLFEFCSETSAFVSSESDSESPDSSKRKIKLIFNYYFVDLVNGSWC